MIHLCAAPILSLHPAFSLLEKNMQLLQLIFQRKCWGLWGEDPCKWLLQLIFRRICEVRTPVSAQCQGTTRAPLGEEGPRPTHQLAIGNSAKRRLRPRPRTMHVERLLVKEACEALEVVNTRIYSWMMELVRSLAYENVCYHPTWEFLVYFEDAPF